MKEHRRKRCDSFPAMVPFRVLLDLGRFKLINTYRDDTPQPISRMNLLQGYTTVVNLDLLSLKHVYVGLSIASFLPKGYVADPTIPASRYMCCLARVHFSCDSGVHCNM